MELIDGIEDSIEHAEITACTDKTITISFNYERKANTHEEREIELTGREIEAFIERRGYSFEDWLDGNALDGTEEELDESYKEALLETLTDWFQIDFGGDVPFQANVLDQLEAA